MSERAAPAPGTAAAAARLAWSLLTELGAPGLERRHAGLAVDPEPSVLLACRAMGADPRLRDQLARWLVHHGAQLSVSRLTGLLAGLGTEARAAFSGLAAAVRAAGGPRLPAPEPAPPWPRTPEAPPLELPLRRPALVRLRLRALCGVGARADLLAELLGRAGGWTRVIDLAHTGYSRRSTAALLAELADGGLAERQSQGNAHRYRLRAPGELQALIGGAGLRWDDAGAALQLVDLSLQLDAFAGLPPPVERVEAAALRDALAGLAHRLSVPAPPDPRAHPEAAAALRAWAAAAIDERLGAAEPP
jgi:hypothetical protein